MKCCIIILGLFIAVSAHELHQCEQPKYELPKDGVACFAIIPKFYHDHASGLCKPLSYDGCNKNENHFDTKEKCDEVCAAWHEQHKDHDHSHHGHDQSHDGHAHSHDGHDHSHDGHDHSHDGHDHSKHAHDGDCHGHDHEHHH